MARLAYIISVLLILSIPTKVAAQAEVQDKVVQQIQKASKKIEKGIDNNNNDTLAKGYYDLGESYYQKGDLPKSEVYYQKSKTLFERSKNAEGVAKSSRALANVQEELHKPITAKDNYNTAFKNSIKIGDSSLSILNRNDVKRLASGNTFEEQQGFIEKNINLGIQNKDTGEIITNYARMGELNLQNNNAPTALKELASAAKILLNAPTHQ